jgi:hypothetical protein
MWWDYRLKAPQAAQVTKETGHESLEEVRPYCTAHQKAHILIGPRRRGRNCSYAAIPLEMNAHQLDARFAAAPTRAFSVAAVVQKWIDADKF